MKEDRSGRKVRWVSTRLNCLAYVIALLPVNIFVDKHNLSEGQAANVQVKGLGQCNVKNADNWRVMSYSRGR